MNKVVEERSGRDGVGGGDILIKHRNVRGSYMDTHKCSESQESLTSQTTDLFFSLNGRGRKFC